MIVQSRLEIFIEFLILLHPVRGNRVPFGSLSAPDVAAYTWDLEVAATNRASCHVCFLRVQIVLQKDIAATGPADYPLTDGDIGIAYRSPVDDRPGVQIELERCLGHTSPGHEGRPRDLLAGEAVAVVQVLWSRG